VTPLHPALAPIAFLVGTWTGAGRGVYPTITPFTYEEELHIGHSGAAFLHHEQRTRHAETGDPMHVETGYWRPGRPGRVELVIAQPTGIIEVDEGIVTGTSIRVRSRLVGLTRTAKPVATVERVVHIDGDHMHYELLMGAMGEVHQLHLEATLQRS
jgi:hypothetical protein